MSKAKADTGGFEVAVLSGLHAGACARLVGRSHTVIGRDMACDLMLRDESVADRHLMFVVLDDKVSAVELDGAVVVDGMRLQQGKSIGLRKGAQLKLGEVLLGVGIPGTDWSQHDAFNRHSRMRRSWMFIQRWLAHSAQRRLGVKLSVRFLAIACIFVALMLPFYQLMQHKRLKNIDPETIAQQLASRLAPMKFADISVGVDQPSGNVVVSGYVPLIEDLRRIELVILATKIRPFMRLFASERIEAESKDYLSRQLPGAQVQLTAVDAVSVKFSDALRPEYKIWLQNEMTRDVPGLRQVLFDGPGYSRFEEVAPAPFSIVSVDSQRFLIDGDGSRFFPGSELSKGVYLKWVGTEKVTVERKERKPN